MAKLKSILGAAIAAHDGRIFRPDRKGVFHVPDDMAEALLPHGFTDAARDDGRTDSVLSSGDSGA